MAGSMDASGEGRTEVKAEWTADEEVSGDVRGARRCGCHRRGSPAPRRTGRRAPPARVRAAALRRTAREWRRAVCLQRAGTGALSASCCGRDFLVGVGGSGEGVRLSMGLGKG